MARHIDLWQQAIKDLGGPDGACYGEGLGELFGAERSAMYEWMRELVELSDRSKVFNLAVVLALAVENSGLMDREV